MRILIAEDETQKLVHIREAASRFFPCAKVLVAKSVRSAIDALDLERPEVMLLDMSLPTFDIGAGEPGGRPQGFGGIEVLRFADFLQVRVATFVITAYEGFEDGVRAVDLTSLDETLKKEHPHNYRGVVYYSGLGRTWADDLGVLIHNADLIGKHK